jgi:predicted nucleic acid-binding protein
MNGKYLLDTNIVVALWQDDPSVVKGIANASSVFVPSIVIGELFYGAYHSDRQTSDSIFSKKWGHATQKFEIWQTLASLP